MAEPPRLRGRDIVCVGFADWDTELWTNQHHLMSRLARDNRVLFVESLGLRRPQLAGRDLTRIWRRLRRGLAPPRASDGLHVLSPLVLPLHGSRVARALNARLLPALVRRAARRLDLQRPILWAYVPQAEVLIDALDPSLIVYHCVDDIAAQERIDTASFRAAETRFAARADLVLASAPALAERLRTISRNVIYAPNVADTELFARALQPSPPARSTPRWPRCRAADRVHRRDRGDQARHPPARRAGATAPVVVVRARRPRRPRRSTHRRLRACGPAQHPPARPPRLRASCPTSCARPTPG